MDVLIIYLFVGAFAGLIAGLFGVGGGLVIVPVLVYVFTKQGMHEAVLVHLAIGTSLATIVFTSISSVRAHHKRGAVLWPIVWRLTPGIILGALIGALIADLMPSSLLRRFFAFFEWVIAAQLLIDFKAKPSRRVPGSGALFWVGNGIGSISAIIGIGGGTLTVPFLVWCNVLMREAVATASACGLPIALAGTVGFMWMGYTQTNLPDWSIGYLYLPALLGIVVASMLLAPVGAMLAHKLPAAKLKRAFGVFLLILGSYMFLSAG